MNENNKPLSAKEYKKILFDRAKKRIEEKKSQKNSLEKKDEKFVEKTSFIQKATSFGKAIVSRGITNKKASEDTKKLRILSCHGSEDFGLFPCSERKNSIKFKDSFYCGACGCGDKKGTQLVNILIDGKEQYSKLDYPVVTCPLKMPGFSNYLPTKPEISENFRKKTIESQFNIDYIKQNSK